MNTADPLDWLLALLIGYSVVRAVARGFLQEALALAGVTAGFLLACWNYAAAGRHLTGLVASAPLADFLGFLLILLGTMLVASLLGKLLKRTASAVGLGFVDRLLGGCFGLLRGALLSLTLLLALAAFLPASAWLQESSLAPYLLRAIPAVSFVMPSELRARLLHSVDLGQQLKHKTLDWIKPGPLPHNTY